MNEFVYIVDIIDNYSCSAYDNPVACDPKSWAIGLLLQREMNQHIEHLSSDVTRLGDTIPVLQPKLKGTLKGL